MNNFEPAAIPAAKFTVGQLVRVDRPSHQGQKRLFEGRIAGLLYTSKNAALASRTSMGWTYTVEVSADVVLNSSNLEPHEIAWEEEITVIQAPLMVSESILSIDLPASVPAPKFRLFQKVFVKGNQRTGVIVSMRYVSLFTALVNRYTSWGWDYEVDYQFDAPIERSLGFIEDESSDHDMTEDGLQALGECGSDASTD